MNADTEEQEDELLALRSILSPEEFVRDEPKSAGEIRVSVELPAGFTVSLQEGEALRQYEMSFLPPLHLTFELPEDYPSSSPPSFTLTCSWLTCKQLSALSAQLTDLYQATGGAVVLFTWLQFLREEALGFLDIHSLLELPSDERSTRDALHDAIPEPKNNQHTADPAPGHQSSAPSEEADGRDPSLSDSEPVAASPPICPTESPPNKDQTLSDLHLTPSQALLSQLLIYDGAQQQKQFATTVFDCGVCFTGLLGSDCVQLPECSHIFCQTCLSQFCKLQIMEGNARGVSCPHADCTATPTPAQVRSLVGEELFSRYDRLLLQNTLDCMQDVVYCPRSSCSSAVIQEESSTAAMCSVCGFAFCVVCRKTYHGANECQKKTERRLTETNEQGPKADLPQSRDGMIALWDDYTSGSKHRRKLLESRYGRETLLVTMEGYLTEDWITFNSKACPHCFCRIQKNRGCNMMTCSQCRRPFCWKCLARLTFLTASAHFRDSPCQGYDYV